MTDAPSMTRLLQLYELGVPHIAHRQGELARWPATNDHDHGYPKARRDGTAWQA
jgi:hypothetical protein